VEESHFKDVLTFIVRVLFVCVQTYAEENKDSEKIDEEVAAEIEDEETEGDEKEVEVEEEGGGEKESSASETLDGTHEFVEGNFEGDDDDGDMEDRSSHIYTTHIHAVLTHTHIHTHRHTHTHSLFPRSPLVVCMSTLLRGHFYRFRCWC
jgi:hypothetical protein